MHRTLHSRSIAVPRAIAVGTILTLLAALLVSDAAFAAQNGRRPRQQPDKPKTIAVLGSSVAAGWVTSFETLHDLQNGYAQRLERLLGPRGWNVVNVSTPGDDTKRVLQRMQRDLRRVKPGYVLIGLSMSNEGLETNDPDTVFESYTTGLKKIIETCRESGMTPIVGLCYANDNFNQTHYAYIKRMNRLINTWDVPSINLLGPLDDGRGRLLKGYTFDLDHPDDIGHEELFYAVSPSLFDALANGKPLPVFESPTGHTTVDKTNPGTPISFIPDDVMHSFAYAFDVRTSSHGRIAAIHGAGGAITIDVDDSRRLRCTSASGAAVSSEGALADGAWHQVIVSHQYLSGRTEFFLDGISMGQSSVQLAPTQFVLGGDQQSAGAAAAVPADYRRLLIYRAPLNDDDVKVLHGGAPLQASLEVFGPLNGERLASGARLTNLAQSTSTLIAYPSDGPEAVAKLTEKINAAAKGKRFIDPNEKRPLTLAPAVQESYVGTYQAEPGMNLIITHEDGRLIFSPNGQGRTQLYAESQTEFFMKIFIPGAPPTMRLGITFIKDKNGTIERLTLHQGPSDMSATRVKQP